MVNYYVQRTPCPRASGSRPPKGKAPQPPVAVDLLAVVAVTVAAVVLTAIFAGRGGQQRPLPDGDGDNPSSIVDIFGSKATTIPASRG